MGLLSKKLLNEGKEQLLFVFATIFSSGIHFLYSIIVKAFVSPLDYGIYSTCLLLQTYLAYLQLGTLNAFNRDYPQLVGAGKTEEAEKYRNTVFTFLLCVFTISTLIIAGILTTIKLSVGTDTRYFVGYLCCSVVTSLTAIENFGNYRARIDKGFIFPSIVTLTELLSVVIGLLLVKNLGYYSIYVTSVSAMLIGIVFYFKRSYRDVKLKIDKKVLISILVSGLPLLINGLIWTVVNSIDKFVILGFIDTEALGLYSIAQNAFTYMILVPSAMSQLFYTKMGKHYGVNQDVNELNKISLNYSGILSIVTCVIAVFAYFLLPFLVELVMPEYSAGIASSQILIIGLSIYAATLINGNILTILRKNRAILLSSILTCIFNAVASVLLVFINGAVIESVALGTSIAYTLSAVVIMIQVHKYASCKILPLLAVSVLPICVTLVPSVIIYNVIANKIVGLLCSLLIIAVICAIVYGKKILSFLKKDKGNN